MASARIQLPTTFSDSRVDSVRVYRVNDNSVLALIAEVPAGTPEFLDSFTFFGANYFYSYYDSTSGAESTGSPISRVFHRVTTTPGIF